MDLPKTRWETSGHHGYADRFARLIEEGADIDGEARLADVLAPRDARILDAGAGIGRVGAALQARGHQVVAVEKDPSLIEEMARRYPDLAQVHSDVLGLTPAGLADAGLPAAYDVVVLVGNVIVLAAPDTERRLLATLRDLLAPDGRILVGYHPVHGHGDAREYPFEEFAADVTAAGLRVEQRFGTYDLRPPSEEYVVAVLAAD